MKTEQTISIEEQIAEVTEGVFDVVAEYEQKKHVPGQMHPASVQEHRGDQGCPSLALRQIGGCHCPGIKKRIDRTCIIEQRKVAKKDQNVGCDKCIRHIGNASRRVVVTNWKHVAKLRLRWGKVKRYALTHFPQQRGISPRSCGINT